MYQDIVKNSFRKASCFRALLMVAICAATLLTLTACSTTPEAKDQPTLIRNAHVARDYFEGQVPGLKAQINNSAGYVVFPDVSQWGILIGGGRYGRGVLCTPDGNQTGWAAINTGSLGLQAGVQGFKALVVFQDKATLQRFKAGQLTGNVSGVLVGGESGGSSTAPFQEGVAVYQGASKGLMAGVNIGLDVIRYDPLEK